jgi:6-pyruvoyltetrahydropterin/6-carboxytetrahydropterin synthase
MSERVYEVGTSAAVTAWHVIPDVEGPEGELHSHDYRIDVVVTRDELDEQGMVCDLDLLRSALDDVVGHVGGRNLEIIQPADAPTVTVEIFARWVHERLSAALGNGDERTLRVRVWETPDAFGGYADAVG